MLFEIMQKLYRRIYNYVWFIRPFALLGILIVFLIYSLISRKINGTEVGAIKILAGAFSCSLLASASHALNNIFDYKIDLINNPRRPLPSGKISFKEAWVLTLALYLVSLCLAFIVNLKGFFLIYFIMAFFTVIYSVPPFSWKKKLWLANLTIAMPRGLLIILAGWSVCGGIWHPLPWFIGLIIFLFLLGGVTTKDLADIRGDRKNNCMTIPVKYGYRKTALIIAPFLILPFFLIPLGIYYNILIPEVIVIMFFSLYGIYIVKTIRDKPKSTIKLENGHISWFHVYNLYTWFHIIIFFAYMSRGTIF